MINAQSALTPREVVDRFEAGQPPAAHFDHEAHIYVAWCYLRVFDAGEALFRFAGALRRFAAAAGAPTKFHLTITWAWMAVISERMAHTPSAEFAAFRAHHRDLFDEPGRILARYYTAETLAGERARAHFVLPDMAGPAHA